MTPAEALGRVVAAVEAEGARLRAEFYAPQGPRGSRGSCPLDREIEEHLQATLQALIPAQFCGEECAVTPGTRAGWVWLVDPHDGTFEYTAGRMALVRAAGGVALDAQGNDIALEGNSERRVSACFAGAPAAARQLVRFDWSALESEPRRESRTRLGFPRREDQGRLSRAQAVLLGQVLGDSLGSRVEGKPAAEIAHLYPEGLRELGDGGP